MPKKASETKTSPKIKVETIEEAPKEPAAPSTTEEKAVDTTPVSEPVETTTPTTPQVASFSQLGSTEKPAPTEFPETPKVEPQPEATTTTTNETETPAEEASEDNGDEEQSSDQIKEWLKEVRPDTSKEVEKKSKISGKLIIFVLLTLALVGVVGGGFYYFNSRVTKEESEVVVEEPSPTSTPTPTEAPEEVDLSEYNLNVLNGSGVAGEAGAVDTLLQGADFTEAETGNADSYDYTTTVISMKKNVPSSVYTTIKEALEDDYIVEKDDEYLDDSSDYDIVVTVGPKRV
jgi:Tfp pilus assembly protein PilP